MRCVMDTGPAVWLSKVGYLDILPNLYEDVFVPEGVFRELSYLNKMHYFRSEALDLVKGSFTLIKLDRNEKRRFHRLAKRWAIKYNMAEADAQVFIAYRDFVKADEMLFANRGAERIFGQHGNARDILMLYELAQETGLWKTKESMKYVQKLVEANYRTPRARQILSQLSAEAF